MSVKQQINNDITIHPELKCSEIQCSHLGFGTNH